MMPAKKSNKDFKFTPTGDVDLWAEHGLEHLPDVDGLLDWNNEYLNLIQLKSSKRKLHLYTKDDYWRGLEDTLPSLCGGIYGYMSAILTQGVTYRICGDCLSKMKQLREEGAEIGNLGSVPVGMEQSTPPSAAAVGLVDDEKAPHGELARIPQQR